MEWNDWRTDKRRTYNLLFRLHFDTESEKQSMSKVIMQLTVAYIAYIVVYSIVRGRCKFFCIFSRPY